MKTLSPREASTLLEEGALLVDINTAPPRPVDWRILGGGLIFGVAVLLLAITGLPYAQEIVFLVSMGVVIAMLRRVVGDLDRPTQEKIFYAALIIFAFRATPLVGQGYTWFTIDVLGFDEAFQGTLNQIGTAFDFGSSPSITASTGVSSIFFVP